MANIQDQKQKVEEEIRKLERMGGSLTGKAKNLRNSAAARFPILFIFLSTFGLVSTFYGFEKIIDEIPFFAENPKTLLFVGLIVLALTGSLYKKLK